MDHRIQLNSAELLLSIATPGMALDEWSRPAWQQLRLLIDLRLSGLKRGIDGRPIAALQEMRGEPYQVKRNTGSAGRKRPTDPAL
jgi:hypothetical protein